MPHQEIPPHPNNAYRLNIPYGLRMIAYRLMIATIFSKLPQIDPMNKLHIMVAIKFIPRENDFELVVNYCVVLYGSAFKS